MRRIELKELKTIQLDILTAIDEFCSSNDIKYSIACGTMLGAVRHGGYIPWDDDIDIYMLREDYNRFETLFPQTLNKYLCLASIKRLSNWTLPFAKVYDNRTLIIEKRSKQSYIGVNIDIFPIDDVPEDEREWNEYNTIRRKKILDLRHKKLRFSLLNSFAKNLGVIAYSLKFLFTSSRSLAVECNQLAQKFNNKGFDRVFENSLGMSVKQPFSKNLFDDIIDIQFEGRYFKGFKNYDEYLTCVFGNYMVLPPSEKRISEHTIDAYWK